MRGELRPDSFQAQGLQGVGSQQQKLGASQAAGARISRARPARRLFSVALIVLWL